MTATADRARRSQAERKAESDARIIEAAIELFAEQGYVRTTLNEIGSLAGYTGGLVSNRFGSKVELLRAVLDDIYETFTRETEEDMGTTESVLDRLDLYAGVFLRRVSRPKSRVRALYVLTGEAMSAVPEIREEVSAFTRHTVKVLTRLLQRGVESGELREDLPAREMAAIILGLMRGLTLELMADPHSLSVIRLLPAIHDVLAGMRRPAS